jgi:tetratricopeptide (TPR) repeat protein
LRNQLSAIYGIFTRFYNLRDNTCKSSTEGDFARAVTFATRVIELNPGSREGYRMRGAIYLDRYRLLKDATPPTDKGKLEELLRSAEMDLNEAIDKGTSDEVDAGAYYNRALAHYYREEYEAAVAVSKRLLGLADKISRVQREQFLPSVYVNLGSFLARLAILAAAAGKPDDATRFSIEAVEAITRGVRDFERTTMEDGGLARLKRELASELDGKQELSQLDRSYVQQLWELVKSDPGRSGDESAGEIR